MRTFALWSVLGLAGACLLSPANSAGAEVQPRVIEDPDWVQAGDPAKFGNLFPTKAMAAGLATGRVVLECIADGEGHMTGCQVRSEEPSAMGFADAALKLASTMAIAPKDQDGQPVKGARVRFAVRINKADASAGAPAEAAARIVQDPIWIATPGPYAFSRALPKPTTLLHVSFRTILRCAIGTDGRMADCAVLSETPPGLGFAQAALKVAPLYRVGPTSKSGEPTAGAVTDITFGWILVTSIEEPKTFVTRPTWAAAPSRADLELARTRAAGNPLAGQLVFNCDVARDGHLTDCESLAANPATAMRAAAALLPKFQLDMSGRKGANARRLYVEPAIQWSDTAGAEPFVLASPQWARGPNDDAIRAAFPAKAAGVADHGHVGLTCIANGAGAMTGCKVIAESPAGLGFGDSALELSRQMAVNVWTEDGRPVEGAQVSYTIAFDRGKAAQ